MATRLAMLPARRGDAAREIMAQLIQLSPGRSEQLVGKKRAK